MADCLNHHEALKRNFVDISYREEFKCKTIFMKLEKE